MRDWTNKPYPLLGVMRVSRLRSLVGYSNRWFDWARGLIGSHARVVNQSAGLSQTFARRISVIYSQVNRWRHSIKILLSKINRSERPLYFNAGIVKSKDPLVVAIEKSNPLGQEHNARFFVTQKTADQMLLRHADANGSKGKTHFENESEFDQEPIVRVFRRGPSGAVADES